jgi:hypothetical protein
MEMKDAQIEWTPTDDKNHTPGVIVYSRTEHLEHVRNAGSLARERYAYSGGACKRDYRGLRRWQAIALMMADFHKLLVRDGLDPQEVHREFLKIDQYRQFIALDCEGAEVAAARANELAPKLMGRRSSIGRSKRRSAHHRGRNKDS